MPRNPPSSDVELTVLLESRRRCCFCFGLYNDLTVHQGQIAHLDRNSENSKLENLAFLCLAHHDWFDTRSSQSKGATTNEAKYFRHKLYAELRRHDESDVRDSPAWTGRLDGREQFTMDVMLFTRGGKFNGPETMTLEESFRYGGPLMLGEASEGALIERLERTFLQTGVFLFGHQPYKAALANEHFQKIKARWWALGLIRPSEKRRALDDTDTYWTLTARGQNYLRTLLGSEHNSMNGQGCS